MAIRTQCDAELGKITVQGRDHKFSIFLDDILFIKAEGNDCNVYLRGDCKDVPGIYHKNGNELHPFKNGIPIKNGIPNFSEVKKIPYLKFVPLTLKEFKEAIMEIVKGSKRGKYFFCCESRKIIFNQAAISESIIPERRYIKLQDYYIELGKDLLRSLRDKIKDAFPDLVQNPVSTVGVQSKEHTRIGPYQFAEFRLMNTTPEEEEEDYEPVDIEILGWPGDQA